MFLPELVDRTTARRTAAAELEMVIDNFAGAGGASLGIEAALGSAVDLAVNHDSGAIEVHSVNHPATRHLIEDVWDVDPAAAVAGRPVGLVWFSPDCKHFSRAKGGKPVEKRIRALAWVVIRWAKSVRPRVIILENVPEFQTWGPLGKDNRPIKAKKGSTFRAWLACLTELGYRVEWRELVAADYGAPTTRKRLFLVARCDDEPIAWPAPTHAPRDKAQELGLKPWRSAAECIDWTLPCPSIFDRRRPLAENTMRRIAKGLRKYVIEATEPFIVHTAHTKTTGRGRYEDSIHRPVKTICASNDKAIVVPYLSKYHGPRDGDANGRASGPDEPVRTLDTQNRFALVAPTLVQTGYGERPGQSPRTPGLGKPLGTVVSGGCKHALVSAFLAKHYGGVVGHEVDRPLGTITAKDHHGVAAAFLTKYRGTCAHGQDARETMPTVTAGGYHLAEVRAFLIKYYSSGGQDQSLTDPMHTLTHRARLGLVTVQGQDYQIVDIGLRMLQPDELLRAQFGRFAKDYVLIGTKARQVAAIGNSVPPELAEAVVRANVTLRRWKDQPSVD